MDELESIISGHQEPDTNPVAPSTSTGSPEWCLSCRNLANEFERKFLSNFIAVKQKIFFTDNLIKMHQDTKRQLEEMTKKYNQAVKNKNLIQSQLQLLLSKDQPSFSEGEKLQTRNRELEQMVEELETQVLALDESRKLHENTIKVLRTEDTVKVGELKKKYSLQISDLKKELSEKNEENRKVNKKNKDLLKRIEVLRKRKNASHAPYESPPKVQILSAEPSEGSGNEVNEAENTDMVVGGGQRDEFIESDGQDLPVDKSSGDELANQDTTRVTNDRHETHTVTITSVGDPPQKPKLLSHAEKLELENKDRIVEFQNQPTEKQLKDLASIAKNYKAHFRKIKLKKTNIDYLLARAAEFSAKHSIEPRDDLVMVKLLEFQSPLLEQNKKALTRVTAAIEITKEAQDATIPGDELGKKAQETFDTSRSGDEMQDDTTMNKELQGNAAPINKRETSDVSQSSDESTTDNTSENEDNTNLKVDKPDHRVSESEGASFDTDMMIHDDVASDPKIKSKENKASSLGDHRESFTSVMPDLSNISSDPSMCSSVESEHGARKSTVQSSSAKDDDFTSVMPDICDTPMSDDANNPQTATPAEEFVSVMPILGDAPTGTDDTKKHLKPMQDIVSTTQTSEMIHQASISGKAMNVDKSSKNNSESIPHIENALKRKLQEPATKNKEEDATDVSDSLKFNRKRIRTRSMTASSSSEIDDIFVMPQRKKRTSLMKDGQQCLRNKSKQDISNEESIDEEEEIRIEKGDATLKSLKISLHKLQLKNDSSPEVSNVTKESDVEKGSTVVSDLCMSDSDEASSIADNLSPVMIQRRPVSFPSQSRRSTEVRKSITHSSNSLKSSLPTAHTKDATDKLLPETTQTGLVSQRHQRTVHTKVTVKESIVASQNKSEMSLPISHKSDAVVDNQPPSTMQAGSISHKPQRIVLGKVTVKGSISSNGGNSKTSSFASSQNDAKGRKHSVSHSERGSTTKPPLPQIKTKQSKQMKENNRSTTVTERSLRCSVSKQRNDKSHVRVSQKQQRKEKESVNSSEIDSSVDLNDIFSEMIPSTKSLSPLSKPQPVTVKNGSYLPKLNQNENVDVSPGPENVESMLDATVSSQMENVSDPTTSPLADCSVDIGPSASDDMKRHETDEAKGKSLISPSTDLCTAISFNTPKKKKRNDEPPVTKPPEMVIPTNTLESSNKKVQAPKKTHRKTKSESVKESFRPRRFSCEAPERAVNVPPIKPLTSGPFSDIKLPSMAKSDCDIGKTFPQYRKETDIPAHWHANVSLQKFAESGKISDALDHVEGHETLTDENVIGTLANNHNSEESDLDNLLVDTDSEMIDHNCGGKPESGQECISHGSGNIADSEIAVSADGPGDTNDEHTNAIEVGGGEDTVVERNETDLSNSKDIVKSGSVSSSNVTAAKICNNVDIKSKRDDPESSKSEDVIAITKSGDLNDKDASTTKMSDSTIMGSEKGETKPPRSGHVRTTTTTNPNHLNDNDTTINEMHDNAKTEAGKAEQTALFGSDLNHEDKIPAQMHGGGVNAKSEMNKPNSPKSGKSVSTANENDMTATKMCDNADTEIDENEKKLSKSDHIALFGSDSNDEETTAVQMHSSGNAESEKGKPMSSKSGTNAVTANSSDSDENDTTARKIHDNANTEVKHNDQNLLKSHHRAKLSSNSNDEGTTVSRKQDSATDLENDESSTSESESNMICADSNDKDGPATQIHDDANTEEKRTQACLSKSDHAVMFGSDSDDENATAAEMHGNKEPAEQSSSKFDNSIMFGRDSNDEDSTLKKKSHHSVNTAKVNAGESTDDDEDTDLVIDISDDPPPTGTVEHSESDILAPSCSGLASPEESLHHFESDNSVECGSESPPVLRSFDDLPKLMMKKNKLKTLADIDDSFVLNGIIYILKNCRTETVDVLVHLSPSVQDVAISHLTLCEQKFLRRIRVLQMSGVIQKYALVNDVIPFFMKVFKKIHNHPARYDSEKCRWSNTQFAQLSPFLTSKGGTLNEVGLSALLRVFFFLCKSAKVFSPIVEICRYHLLAKRSSNLVVSILEGLLCWPQVLQKDEGFGRIVLNAIAKECSSHIGAKAKKIYLLQRVNFLYDKLRWKRTPNVTSLHKDVLNGVMSSIASTKFSSELETMLNGDDACTSQSFTTLDKSTRLNVHTIEMFPKSLVAPQIVSQVLHGRFWPTLQSWSQHLHFHGDTEDKSVSNATIVAIMESFVHMLFYYLLKQKQNYKDQPTVPQMQEHFQTICHLLDNLSGRYCSTSPKIVRCTVAAFILRTCFCNPTLAHDALLKWATAFANERDSPGNESDITLTVAMVEGGQRTMRRICEWLDRSCFLGQKDSLVNIIWPD